MPGQFWKLLLFAAVLVIYAAIGLSSHQFDPEPPWQKNGVVPTRGEGLFFLAPGVASVAQPPEWLPAVIRESAIEIELEVRSYQEDQYGPARILTISRDTGSRNLTIGQQGDQLVIRLRTVETSENGLPAYEIPDIFGDSEMHSIMVTVDGTMFRVTVDGELNRQCSLPDEPLRNWDPEYRLLLGNEDGGRRPWLGEIRRASIRVQGEAFEYAEPESLIVPEYFHLRGAPMTTQTGLLGEGSRLRETTSVAILDAAKNLCGFVPLGFLLVILWRRMTLTSVMIACGVLSIFIEMIQFVLPGRYPHLSDFILNVFGGVLGALLGRALLGVSGFQRTE